MASSIPGPLLLEMARKQVPNLPLRENSTWVAILFHSILTSADASKNPDCFMWLKAHRGITLRTLKYKYYERQPFEDLVLQYGRGIPHEMTSVGELRDHRKSKNWIVLRALDSRDITDEHLLAEIQANVHDERRNPLNCLTGYDEQNAISIESDATDTDDDTKAQDESESRGSAGTASEDESSDHLEQDQALKTCENDLEECTTSQDDEPTRDEKGQTQAAEEGLSSIGLKRQRSPSPSSQPGPTRKHQKRINGDIPSEEAARNETGPKHLDYSELHTPQHSIQPSTPAHDPTPSTFYCEVPKCRKPSTPKPWTISGPDGHPLCTDCSRARSRFVGDDAAVKALDAALSAEIHRKVAFEQAGAPQDMDGDAPVFEPCSQQRNAKPVSLDTSITPIGLAPSNAKPSKIVKLLTSSFTPTSPPDHMQMFQDCEYDRILEASQAGETTPTPAPRAQSRPCAANKACESDSTPPATPGRLSMTQIAAGRADTVASGESEDEEEEATLQTGNVDAAADADDEDDGDFELDDEPESEAGEEGDDDD